MIKIIKTTEDYDKAMARVMELMHSGLQSNTDNFDEFELLTLLIKHYEDRMHPIDIPDPIEAIKFRMDQQGLTHADMVPFMGSKSKVSEVLNRKKPLSLSMIRRLHEGLGISAKILIQDFEDTEWCLISNKIEFFHEVNVNKQLLKLTSSYSSPRNLGRTIKSLERYGFNEKVPRDKNILTMTERMIGAASVRNITLSQKQTYTEDFKDTVWS